MVEVLTQEVPSQGLSPTDLNLFNYSGSRMVGLQDLSFRLIHFGEMEANNAQVWTQRWDKIRPKITSLQGRISEFAKEAMNTRSSISSGMVYLRMLDDFKQKGLTDQEIFDFFKKCLYVSNTLPRQAHQVHQRTGNVQTAMTLAASKDRLGRIVHPLIAKVAADVPSWFDGNKDAFFKLMVQYSLFPVLLQPNISFAQVYNRAAEAKAVFLKEGVFSGEEVFGETDPDYMPDWLLDNSLPPTRQEVETELDEDKKTYEQLKEQTSKLFRQGKQLVEIFGEKRTKAGWWLQDERNKLVFGRRLMPEVLLAGVFLEEGEKLIRQFMQDNERLADSETLALFVEDILKTAGISKGGSIDKAGLILWSEYLAAYRPDAQDQAKEEFKKIRDVNKRGYNVLAFDLAGLLSVLPEEDFDLIDEYTKVTGDDANSLIFFTADVLADSLKNVDTNNLPANNPLKKSIGEYREFTGKFLRKNWDWLYHKLIKLISGIEFEEETEILAEVDMTTSEDLEVEIGEVPAQQLQDFEQEESEILSDKLKNWTVLYALDRSYQGRLMEVGGLTGEERDQFLKSFFVRNGISCSIGSRSVISTLEWKVDSPQAVEHLVPSKDINGERWKKIKRGAVRIFYKMDPEEHQLLFFVHQKKAWEYGF